MAALSLFALNEPDDGFVQLPDPAPEARKAELGQFMTPAPIAMFMSQQFESQNLSDVVLLDAGAGQGSLTAAFATRWKKTANAGSRLSVHAYELDPRMIEILEPMLRDLESDQRISGRVSAFIPTQF
jgi:adenine-specific DNA-methyltransferase